MYKNIYHTIKATYEITIPHYRVDRFAFCLSYLLGEDKAQEEINRISTSLKKIKEEYLNNNHTIIDILKGQDIEIDISKKQNSYLRKEIAKYDHIQTYNLNIVVLQTQLYKNANAYYREKNIIKYPILSTRKIEKR